MPPPLPAFDFGKAQLESFDDTEEDTITIAISIATDEHLTFMPQTSSSVFTRALEPLDTTDSSYLDTYHVEWQHWRSSGTWQT